MRLREAGGTMRDVDAESAEPRPTGTPLLRGAAARLAVPAAVLAAVEIGRAHV